MKRLLFALTALGLFGALAAYSSGKYVSRDWDGPVSQHPTLGEFKAGKAADAAQQDVGVVYRTGPSCGNDYLCLIAWAEKPRAAKPKFNRVGDVR